MTNWDVTIEVRSTTEGTKDDLDLDALLDEMIKSNPKITGRVADVGYFVFLVPVEAETKADAIGHALRLVTPIINKADEDETWAVSLATAVPVD